MAGAGGDNNPARLVPDGQPAVHASVMDIIRNCGDLSPLTPEERAAAQATLATTFDPLFDALGVKLLRLAKHAYRLRPPERGVLREALELAATLHEKHREQFLRVQWTRARVEASATERP